MTTNFRLGDKIKAGPFTADLGLTPGNIYTVNHIDDFGLVQPDGGRRHHYHPSHFKLVERASAEPDETYCVKDEVDGDWHVSTESAEGPFLLVSNADWTARSLDCIDDCYGIDAEPLPSRKYPTTAEYLAAYGAEDDGGEYETEMALAYDEADPAPLQPGDWVQVWAQIDGPGNSEKNTYIRIHAETTRAVTGAWVRNDAIVRPAEGQVPPWVEEPVKPEEPTGLGAVVSVRHDVYEWARAVRTDASGRLPWYYTDSSGNGGNRDWAHLDVIEVVSPGVEF